MAGLPPLFDQQFFDNSGRPLALGFLYTFVTGTTTPKTSYADQAQTIVNPNPITLDASGRCQLYLGSGEYRIRLQDSSGAFVTEADDVSSPDDLASVAADAALAELASTTAGKGASLVGVEAGQTVQDALDGVVSTSGFASVQLAATAADNDKLRVVGANTVSAAVTPAASGQIEGVSPSATIQTVTTDHHLVALSNDGARVKDVTLSGVKGTTILNNSAVVVSNDYGVVDGINATGMSGMAVYLTGSTNARVSFNRVYGLTPDSSSYVNGSSVASYTGNSYGQIVYNILEGGGVTEVGVLLQLDSTKNTVMGNHIKAHESYGVIDYDNTPKNTYSTVAFNRIEDINGSSTFGGSKGAGVYGVGVGALLVTGNQIRNTNISTTTETLAPGGVGFNSMFAPCGIHGNSIVDANWYGVQITTNTSAAIDVGGNVIKEAKKGSVYAKASSHVNVHGGVYEQLTTTPLTARTIAFNVAGGGPFTGCSVVGARVRGGLRGIESGSTNNVVIAANNISEVTTTAGIGLRITTGSGLAVTGCVVDVGSSTGAALDVSSVTDSVVSGCVFKGSASTLISIAGTCTGFRFDRSNILVGATMNNISNNGTGAIVETWGDAAPTLLPHQKGDKVWFRDPVAAGGSYTECTVSGTPGTWVTRS